MAGPERKFIDKVHRLVDPKWCLHKQCNTGTMGANGTPDYYYEAYNHTTWIEYKFVERFPTQFLIINPKCRFKLSPLQRRWLNRAVKNKVPAAIVLGSSEGALIIEKGRWEEPINTSLNRVANRIVTPREVAHFAAGFGDYRIAI